MLITLVAWLVVTYFILCYGVAFNKIWNKISLREENRSLDEIIIMGICVVTVCAQYVSLLYKIGMIANMIFFIGSVVILVLWHKEIGNYILSIRNNSFLLLIFAGVSLIVVLMIGVLPDEHYDTALYHAQAIRWIEKYGVVKGLGNLHHRLAYNSSFLVLQALFGYKSIFGIELHSMNAYIAWILLIWAVGTLSIWKLDKIRLSDAGKILYIFYLFLEIDKISSPNTDFFAVSITLYILSKWLEVSDKDNKQVERYIYLCFLAVFALTLKLSAGACLLLSFYPLYLLIKNKQWKLMWYSLMIGIFICMPFVLRNVLISGYILYPVPSLSVSGFEWKMSLKEVIQDKEEIAVWARGNEGSGCYEDSWIIWVPRWYKSLDYMWKCIVCLFVGSVPLVCIYYIMVNREELKRNIEVFIAIIGLLTIWFVSAPGIRFGGIFLLFIPTMTILSLGIRLKNLRRIENGYEILLGLFLFGIMLGVLRYVRDVDKYIVYPAAYTDYPIEETEIGGVKFYYPKKGDQTGYESFPQLTYLWRTDEIELREYGNLKEGFRMSKEK